MARLRSVAITWGPAPRRIWERSSSKVTSRTQWRRFSIVQWARTSARSRAGDAWAGVRLVTPYTVSRCAVPVAHSVTARCRQKTWPTWGKAR